jgi:hypothetical protein
MIECFILKYLEYSTIVLALDKEIEEKRRILEMKRLARKEFTYSLSRQMMKSISNLSMEAMNLNQIDLIGNFAYIKIGSTFVCFF